MSDQNDDDGMKVLGCVVEGANMATSAGLLLGLAGTGLGLCLVVAAAGATLGLMAGLSTTDLQSGEANNNDESSSSSICFG